MTKPKCPCWEDTQKAAERENQIDAIGIGMTHMLGLNCQVQGICADGAIYAAAAAITGLIIWAAYQKQGNEEYPTQETLEEVGKLIATYTSERLSGARNKDLDQILPHSNLRN